MAFCDLFFLVTKVILNTMKKIILQLLFLTPFFISAQSGFGEAQLIGDDFQTTKVIAADIDNDGDIDVLSSGWNYDTIAWYENLDGQGTFGSVQYVTQSLDFTQSLSTADFNGDGAIDILATSKGDDKVVWYENLDGQGTFSTAHIIDDFANHAEQAMAADIDGDDDIDVVHALSTESKVVWYENLDGEGNFSAEKIITNTATGVYSLDIADVDGDGFIDVLANSSSIAMPSWYKNDGLGNFGTENIIDLNGTLKLVTADIDGDNNQDIIKEHIIDGIVKIHWLENTDGLGTFTQNQQITDIIQPSDIFPEDIDNDGDIDLLITYVGDGKISWFENLDGLGTFGERRIIEDLASISIVAADIDGDGYKDVVTRINQSQVVWYKNLTYLGVNDNNLQNIVLIPNPTSGVIKIENNAIPINNITIYNVLGKLVLLQKNTTSVDITSLQTGIYFLKINTLEGNIIKKVIKE